MKRRTRMLLQFYNSMQMMMMMRVMKIVKKTDVKNVEQNDKEDKNVADEVNIMSNKSQSEKSGSKN